MKPGSTALFIAGLTLAGARGSVIYIPSNQSVFSLTELPLVAADADIATNYTRAAVFFGVYGMPLGRELDIAGVTLKGNGITTTLNYTNTFNFTSDDNWISTNVEDADPLNFTSFRPLDTPVDVWNSGSNRVSFTLETTGFLPGGAQLFYGVQYRDSGLNTNSAWGSATIQSVWEWDLSTNESPSNGGTSGTDWTLTNMDGGSYTIAPNTPFNIDLGANVDLNVAEFWK